MKNLTNHRNTKMNSTLRSILASSMIALTMMSCSKENIEPAAVNSMENARTRSNQSLNYTNDLSMIDIRLTATGSQAETRITISSQAILTITSTDNSAEELRQYRLNNDQINQLQSLISKSNTDQDYHATNKQAYRENQNAETYTATNKQAFLENQNAEAYSATNKIAFSNNENAEGYSASNSLAYNINQVEFRSCTTCNPNVFTANGNAQERMHTTNFINEVDRIVNLQGLLAMSASASRRN